MDADENPNETLLQSFEWHTEPSPDTSHYELITRLIPQLAKIGITGLWLPPGCKANNPRGNGYDIYDLWDLGEFEQKGSRSTKWGGRSDLDELLRTTKDHGVDVVWDAVLNHKQAGDRTESDVWAVEVDPKDRRFEICPPKTIEAWLKYDFPGRAAEGMKYSSMTWKAEHFNGTDWDQSRQRNAIYKLIDDPSLHPTYRQPTLPPSADITPPRSRLSRLRRRFSSQTAKHQLQRRPPARRPGKGWADDVDDENGNNDYLLFSNIDHTHAQVRQDMFEWGRWMLHEVGIHGFRLDAVQHFSYSFTKEWIEIINASALEKSDRNAFIVGEVWTGDICRITKWLDAVHSPNCRVLAYDSPLLYNFSRISEDSRTRSKNTDFRTILRDSLVMQRPNAAVTLVTNHDTQPGQTCYTPMRTALKTLFYAFILLRKNGHPCVFWGDLFGTNGPHAEQPACLVRDKTAKGGARSLLPDLIVCRKLFAYGSQTDYFDSATHIGWTRSGTSNVPGIAVLLNIATAPIKKRMFFGEPGDVWIDALGQLDSQIVTDTDGYSDFPCNGESVAVFVRKTAGNVGLFPVNFDAGPILGKALDLGG